MGFAMVPPPRARAKVLTDGALLSSWPAVTEAGEAIVLHPMWCEAVLVLLGLWRGLPRGDLLRVMPAAQALQGGARGALTRWKGLLGSALHQ